MVTANLSCSTNDHSSLSRWGPVPTLSRERPLQHFGARYYVSTIHYTNILQILSTSCFAVCGHHPSLGISLNFSYCCLVHQTTSCHLCSRSAFTRLARLVLPCMVDTLALYELCSPLLCHRGNSVRLLLPFTLEHRCFFFFLPGQGPPPEIAISRGVHWAIQICFHPLC